LSVKGSIDAVALSLGSIGGTEIRIHVTFLLFLVGLAAIYYRAGGPEAAWQGTIFIALPRRLRCGHLSRASRS